MVQIRARVRDRDSLYRREPKEGHWPHFETVQSFRDI